MKQLLEERIGVFARVLSQEHGKGFMEAKGSVRRGIQNVEVATGISSLMMGYNLNEVTDGVDEVASRYPLGVFTAICPFNFPAMVPLWFLPYAIACGNTFVLKPSEQVPISSQLLVQALHDVGLPPGVVTLLHGGKDTANVILTHPMIQGVSFVGSTPVAKHIYQTAANYGKRVQCQGGAKNALVIMSDADLASSCVNLLGSAFGNAGQRCLAGSIVIPVGEAYDIAIPRIVEETKQLSVGYGLDKNVQVGPVISEGAKNRILAAIERAIQQGASLLVDGRVPSLYTTPGIDLSKGYFVGPTILDKVTPEMEIFTQEVFGPVLAIVSAENLTEAMNLIHQIPYGNAASIYTQNGKAAREFSQKVHCGNIGINIGVAAPMPFFPFGGARQSFFGDLHAQGRDGINFYTDRKVIITRW
jgi:malonate-semialdehyde dehydrogenase (acetylating)/methylmalonate-semialdehyde dehydrogenase